MPKIDSSKRILLRYQEFILEKNGLRRKSTKLTPFVRA